MRVTLNKYVEEKPFSEPWQAQAFAITLKLHETGVFTWPEWAEYLSKEIANSQKPDENHIDNYYLHWLNALEKITLDKGLVLGSEVIDRKQRWKEAAENTKHGKPIELAVTNKGV